MTQYGFKCECGDFVFVEGSMAHPPQTQSCSWCNQSMQRVYGANVGAFKAYKAHHFPGKPVEITCPRQRDILLDEHNITYDSGRYVRKPVFRAAVEDITIGDVREGISRGLHLKCDNGDEEFKDSGPPAEVPIISSV